MEGDDLICNFKKCRKRLTDVAYVTACSHVFCDEDGTREFNKSKTCPACQTTLSNKFEIVRNNLLPSEQYKSMILAGLKPDVISEVCSRALSFWVYQSHQEKTYQEYTGNKARERATQLEQYYEQIIARTTSELTNLKLQVSASKKETEETKKKYSEISEKLMEKNRQHQKLQSMYDSMRRKYMTLSNFDGDPPTSLAPTVYHPPPNITTAQGDNFAHSLELQDGSTTYYRRRPGRESSGASNCVSPKDFQFRPKSDSHDMPANQVHQEFSIGLGTPRR